VRPDPAKIEVIKNWPIPPRVDSISIIHQRVEDALEARSREELKREQDKLTRELYEGPTAEAITSRGVSPN
jgi:hypothetical protein